MLPTVTGDQLATAVVMLDYLAHVHLGPSADAESVAESLDRVATDCSPHRDLAVNPAKMLAIAMADTNPLVWGGSVLAARAARRLAESLRRTSGRSAIAGDAEHLLPVIEATKPHDVFADPFSEESGRPPTAADDPRRPIGRRRRPRAGGCPARRRCAARRTRRDGRHRRRRRGRPLRLAPAAGTYAAEYLRVGLVED